MNWYKFNIPVLMKNDFIFILDVPFATTNHQIFWISTCLTITKVKKKVSKTYLWWIDSFIYQTLWAAVRMTPGEMREAPPFKRLVLWLKMRQWWGHSPKWVVNIFGNLGWISNSPNSIPFLLWVPHFLGFFGVKTGSKWSGLFRLSGKGIQQTSISTWQRLILLLIARRGPNPNTITPSSFTLVAFFLIFPLHF